ncbi:SDR family oxidoreductase [Nocardia bovistercoris]|uniref:SDR family oxidoreductase n=1 Tax=Nocardia bovistercoris TaxID=2785916 RepID=A0A931N2Q5_9NOCA|nr:SDR family oxidoreductase [Nocardia bovistercoris]MBH0776301.1 SDR family oxidoreductase [Nocardia bovistercoris]
MSETRSVLITGASRGLGLAAATYLYARGWQVIAAMRAPDKGMATLREATGAAADDPRLLGVELDLCDPESVAAAAATVIRLIGAPYAVVHNAGIAAAGAVEETPMALWQQMFATHLFGPVALTKDLLPGMRAAGRGRIVLISSAGGVRGMPSISAYSAAKAALERWGESLAGEIAPYGLGVQVIVAGVFDTEIITDEGTSTFRDFDGPYGRHHRSIDHRGRAAMTIARPPEKFAALLARALERNTPYSRRSAGFDAAALVAANKILPTTTMHQVVRVAMGLPKFRSMSPDATHTSRTVRAVTVIAKALPQPVLRRLGLWSTKIRPPKQPSPLTDPVASTSGDPTDSVAEDAVRRKESSIHD